MANKVVAVFILFVVVGITMNTVEVEAMYKTQRCDNRCYDRCMAGNKGATAAYCKANCDEACLDKNIASTQMSPGSRHEQLLNSQSTA